MADRVCTVDGCDKPAHSKGWCSTHYSRWYHNGDPQSPSRKATRPSTCTIEGCERPHKAKGWCNTHYQRWRSHGNALVVSVGRRHRTRRKVQAAVCTTPGCSRRATHEALCRRCLKDRTYRALNDIPVWLDLDHLAAVNTRDDSWRNTMACGDHPVSVFFPPGDGGRFDFTRAAQICDRCPTRAECLASWLASEPESTDKNTGGYVGGCTPKQRSLIRVELRRRKAAA